MSYTPTTWNTGDTITATALNKIEQGIAGGGGLYVINASISTQQGYGVLDKTASEILAAINRGALPVIYGISDYIYLQENFLNVFGGVYLGRNQDEDGYYFVFAVPDITSDFIMAGAEMTWYSFVFYAETAEDYPRRIYS